MVDKLNIGVIVSLFLILWVFHMLEFAFRQVGGDSIPILPPGDPLHFIDDKCNFIIRRQKERTKDPTSGMTQPELRPCGLNQIFFQNCKGELLNGKGRGKPLEWEKEADIHQSGEQAGCFLVVPPLNPMFKQQPGFYCSLKSMKYPNHYIKVENGKAVLDLDPNLIDRCWWCDRPIFKEYIFKITRGFAKFNRAFSILNWRHEYMLVNGKHLAVHPNDPKTNSEKLNATLYFGPNNHFLYPT